MIQLIKNLQLINMEQAMLWVTIFGIIVLPIIGWIFNSLITNKINELREQQKEDRELLFKRLDEERLHVETECVRKDMYEQSMRHHKENEEATFKGLLSIVNTQFANLEANMLVHSKDIKDLEGKIDSIKDLINNKLQEKK